LFALAQAEPMPVSVDEEIYAEVGDLLTYYDVADPNTKLYVRIVDGPTNLDAGELNENAPLAKVLLDMTEGDENELIVPGKPKRTFRLLKIERPE
jgi:transcription elongation GreA/GreB family factor